MMTLSKKLVGLSLSLAMAGCSSLGNEPTLQHNGVAVNGYDVVAYFTENKPVKGLSKFSSEYHDLHWYFSSEKNKELFEQDQQHYLPQYGGYCAYGMSKGFVVDTDPHAFTIVNDKLYLNYSLGVRDTWQKETAEYIKSADTHWLKKTKK